MERPRKDRKLEKVLLFLVEADNGWIGGVYYVRNFLKTLSCSEWILNCEVHVLCSKEHAAVFEPLATLFSYFQIHFRNPSGRTFWVRKFDSLMKEIEWRFEHDTSRISREIQSDAIYPVTGRPFFGVRGKQIHWIPDFQHCALPDYFSASQIEERNRVFGIMAKSRRDLVLSSRDSLGDFERYFSGHSCSAHCIPFIADIEDELDGLCQERKFAALNRFGLLGEDGNPVQYYYVPNQFWVHKNHAVVIEALGLLKARGGSPVQVVCTGNTIDPRCPDHFTVLMQRAHSLGVEEHFKVLSMVSRQEQLSIMAYCLALLQPSRFEGWGTGVQEAKRLGKRLLLSDIGIHHEQGGADAAYFDPMQPEELANLLSNNCEAVAANFDFELLRRKNNAAGREYAEWARAVFT